MERFRRSILVVVILALGILEVRAQEVRMAASVVGAGAGQAENDAVRLQSTIGQAFAGRAFGDAFILGVGFAHQVAAASGIVNIPPSAPVITEPADGAEIVVGGGPTGAPLDPSTVLTITWTESIDPEGEPVTYYWQAFTQDFSELLLSRNAGAETSHDVTFGKIADALDVVGVELGESITIVHRVAADDGQDFTFGLESELTLVRGTIVSTDEPAEDLPRTYELHQNYPNPFNPATTIAYDLPAKAHVRLIVFDIFGREIATLIDRIQSPGRYDVSFEAEDLASGLYLYRIEAGDFQTVRRMMLVK